jgi:hypothetical protein
MEEYTAARRLTFKIIVFSLQFLTPLILIYILGHSAA